MEGDGRARERNERASGFFDFFGERVSERAVMGRLNELSERATIFAPERANDE